ncbi:MAG: YqgE/AlgH family protein [Bryobacterales bacterium]|nr:YqgE/AlgH family protein [Bryobacterales bacterium]
MSGSPRLVRVTAVLALLAAAVGLLWFRAHVPAGLRPAGESAREEPEARGPQLSAGRLLVASRNLPDPNFAETVVLLIQYDAKSAAGLVVNRPTDIPLARVFEDLREARGRRDPAYLGGPVGRTGILALLRSSQKPEDARHLFADVYLIAGRAQLAKAFAARVPPTAFRVYAGYAGWGAGQLERELKMNAWHVFPPDATAVFDPDSDSVWPRLIERTERRVAAGKRRQAPVAGVLSGG